MNNYLIKRLITSILLVFFLAIGLGSIFSIQENYNSTKSMDATSSEINEIDSNNTDTDLHIGIKDESIEGTNNIGYDSFLLHFTIYTLDGYDKTHGGEEARLNASSVESSHLGTSSDEPRDKIIIPAKFDTGPIGTSDAIRRDIVFDDSVSPFEKQTELGFKLEAIDTGIVGDLDVTELTVTRPAMDIDVKTPTPQDITSKDESVTISVDVEQKGRGLDEENRHDDNVPGWYTLLAYDSEGAELGTQTTITYGSIGTHQLEIRDLTIATTYSGITIKAMSLEDEPYNLSQTASFNVSTNDRDLEEVSTPSESDITTTSSTATIVTNVSCKTGDSEVNEYVLQVQDSSGAKIGSQTDYVSTSTGNQTITLTGLSVWTEYSDSKIVAYKSDGVGTEELASSSTFLFKTLRNDVASLTTPVEADITTTLSTADINTTITASTNTNETLNEYVLQVQDSSGAKLGTQADQKFTEDGLQTINLTGLNVGQEYSDSKIVAYRSDGVGTEELASSGTFVFSTLKHDVASLTTPVEDDITTTLSTADINTTITGTIDTSNESLNEYVLQVQNDAGVKLGTQTDQTFTEDGAQTINLTGLSFGTEYVDSKIVAYKSDSVGTGELAVSNTFTFSTLKHDVASLTTPVEDDITTTLSTADINTTITATADNEIINEYVLEVKDSLGVKLGTQVDQTFTEDGAQTIKLEGLVVGQEYVDSKIVAYRSDAIGGTELASSGTFTFSTLKHDVASLTTPEESDMTTTTNTANINTTITASTDTNESLNEYVLEVQDSLGIKLGTQVDQTFTEDGLQTILLEGLEANKEYTDSKIVAYKSDGVGGTELASSGTFTFTTSKYDVASLTTPVEDDITTTKTTADITTTVGAPLDTNITLNEYVLEVQSDAGIKLGTQTDQTFTEDGKQTINLTGLNVGQEYVDNKIVAYRSDAIGGTELASSGTFTFLMVKNDVASLTTPTTEDISTAVDTADITTTVTATEVNNQPLNEYVLQIQNKSGDKIGTQVDQTFTEDGEQIVSLEGLITGKSYDDSRVVAYKSDDVGENPLAFSDIFTFSTSKYNVASLTTPEESDISAFITTANITTTVTSTPDGSNKVLNEYVLQVQNDFGVKIGTQEDQSFTKDGEQTINLTGLNIGTDYKRNKIVAYGVKDVGGIKLAESKNFSFSTSSHVIDGIDSVSIDKTKVVTENSFFINLRTLINDEDDKGDKFLDYQILVHADFDNKEQELIFTSANQSDYKENESIEITGLNWSTKYSNIKVELVDASSAELLGSESKSIGEITTTVPINYLFIDNADVISSTKDSFTFLMDIRNDKEDVTPYMIQAISKNEDNPVIWTSVEQTNASEGMQFTAKGLDEKEYTDIRFQLIASDSTSRKLGPEYDTGLDIWLTSNTVKEIVKDSVKISNVKSKSFIISLRTIGNSNSNDGEGRVFPFIIAIYANDDFENPIYLTEEQLTVGDVSIEVGGLKPEKKYENITVQLLDINDTSKTIGDSINAGNIKTLKTILSLVSKIIVWILLIVTIVFTIIASVFLVKNEHPNLGSAGGPTKPSKLKSNDKQFKKQKSHHQNKTKSNDSFSMKKSNFHTAPSNKHTVKKNNKNVSKLEKKSTNKSHKKQKKDKSNQGNISPFG